MLDFMKILDVYFVTHYFSLVISLKRNMPDVICLLLCITFRVGLRSLYEVTLRKAHEVIF